MQLSIRMPEEAHTPPFFQCKDRKVRILIIKEAKSLRSKQRCKVSMPSPRKTAGDNYQT